MNSWLARHDDVEWTGRGRVEVRVITRVIIIIKQNDDSDNVDVHIGASCFAIVAAHVVIMVLHWAVP
ncbi:unnamed protein product [Linum trigynum]|uniref:Transmembrane protein n=1 Tax=Linum trigynum TaxID=586398 RepID=A0AAV2FJR3_9ROSI